MTVLTYIFIFTYIYIYLINSHIYVTYTPVVRETERLKIESLMFMSGLLCPFLLLYRSLVKYVPLQTSGTREDHWFVSYIYLVFSASLAKLLWQTSNPMKVYSDLLRIHDILFVVSIFFSILDFQYLLFRISGFLAFFHKQASGHL